VLGVVVRLKARASSVQLQQDAADGPDITRVRPPHLHVRLEPNSKRKKKKKKKKKKKNDNDDNDETKEN
jgi:hypothetical protein